MRCILLLALVFGAILDIPVITGISMVTLKTLVVLKILIVLIIRSCQCSRRKLAMGHIAYTISALRSGLRWAGQVDGRRACNM